MRYAATRAVLLFVMLPGPPACQHTSIPALPGARCARCKFEHPLRFSCSAAHGQRSTFVTAQHMLRTTHQWRCAEHELAQHMMI